MARVGELLVGVEGDGVLSHDWAALLRKATCHSRAGRPVSRLHEPPWLDRSHIVGIQRWQLGELVELRPAQYSFTVRTRCVQLSRVCARCDQHRVRLEHFGRAINQLGVDSVRAVKSSSTPQHADSVCLKVLLDVGRLGRRQREESLVDDGKVDADEKHWLKELKLLADKVCPEFMALYNECMAS